MDIENVNGGGLAGAVCGYIVGVAVGGVAAAVVTLDKQCSGANRQNPLCQYKRLLAGRHLY